MKDLDREIQKLRARLGLPPETKALEKLIVILARKTLLECDNVGGNVREECQCDSCEGSRLADEIEKGEQP